MEAMFFLAGIAIVTALGVYLARNRGRDPVTWGIICALVGLFGIAALVIMGDTDEVKAQKATALPYSPGYTDELQRLSELHDKGALTDDEWSTEKQRVLAAH